MVYTVCPCSIHVLVLAVCIYRGLQGIYRGLQGDRE